MRRIIGDKVSPWKTPHSIGNRFVVLLREALQLRVDIVDVADDWGGDADGLSITTIIWWDIEPKALLRPRKVMYRGRLFVLTLLRMAEVVKMCSITPGVPDTNTFWVEGSLMSLANLSTQSAMTCVYKIFMCLQFLLATAIQEPLTTAQLCSDSTSCNLSWGKTDPTATTFGRGRREGKCVHNLCTYAVV